MGIGKFLSDHKDIITISSVVLSSLAVGMNIGLIGTKYEFKKDMKDGTVKVRYVDVNEDGLKDVILRKGDKHYATFLQQKDGSYLPSNEILKNEQKKLDQKYETLDNKMGEK